MEISKRLAQPDFMWTYLAHFGTAMWRRRYETLRFDFPLWKEMTEKMAKKGAYGTALPQRHCARKAQGIHACALVRHDREEPQAAA